MSPPNGCPSTKIDGLCDKHTIYKMSKPVTVKKPEFAHYTIGKGSIGGKLTIPKDTAVRSIEIDISDETFRPVITIKHKGIELEINSSDILMFKNCKRRIIRKNFKNYVGNGDDSDSDDSDDDEGSEGGSEGGSVGRSEVSVDSGKMFISTTKTFSSDAEERLTGSVDSCKMFMSTSSDDTVVQNKPSKVLDSLSDTSTDKSDKKDKNLFSEAKFKTPVFGTSITKTSKPEVSDEPINAPCYIAIADSKDIVNVSAYGDVVKICSVENLHKAYMIQNKFGATEYIALQVNESGKVYNVYDLHYLKFDHGSNYFFNFEPSIKGILDGWKFHEIPEMMATTKMSDQTVEYSGKLYEISQ